MKSIKLYMILMLSCVLSLGLSAQETYTWAYDVFTKSFYMYKIDFFNATYELYFRIDESEFTHPNMTGSFNRIRSFDFTKDRSAVYFMETEGDIYKYDIASNSLTFIKDVTPDTSPWLVHAYEYIDAVYFINDSLLYCGGYTTGFFNINNNVFTTLRKCPSHSAGATEFELNIDIWQFTKHKDKYYYISAKDKLFIRPDLYEPESNTFLYNYRHSDSGIGVDPRGGGIVSYQFDCDSTILYILGAFDIVAHSAWYRVDLNTFEVEYSHEGVFPFGQAQQTYTRHYNAQEWEDCQRLVDLDEDDSTEPDIDYKIESLCYHSGIPFSDVDIKVSNEFPLDSVVVEIQNSRMGQQLSFASGNFIVNAISSSYVRIENSSTSTNKDFEDAIKGALYIDTGNKQGGDIIINITAWYDGKSGRTAKAMLNIVDPLPDAGDDVNIEYCKEENTVNLYELLAANSDKNGKFYNQDFDEIQSKFELSQVGNYTTYYIVENQGCTDTAQLQISVNPLPTINPLKDTTLCFGESIVIDISDLSDDILWNDGDKSKIKTINASGKYSYTVINAVLCVSTDTFEIQILPKPQTNPVEAKVCAGEIFKFMGKEYSTSGIYHDTVYGIMGCDSLIFDIQLGYFDKIPLEYTGELGFCEGESTVIKIISNHTNLTINEEEFQKSIELTESGQYKISGYDTNGCLDEIELNLTQYPSPQVMTEDLLDISYQSGLILPVEYSGNIELYKWIPKYGLDCYDCPYPELIEKRDGIFTIEVINQYGCTDTEDLEVRFKRIEYDIPNVIYNNPINPINGMFYVNSNTEFRYNLRIFNRWGNLIYEAKDIKSNNPNECWRPEGKVNSGVYVYMITLEEEGEKKVIAGDLTVL